MNVYGDPNRDFDDPYRDFDDADGGGMMLLMFACIRCGSTAAANPDTVPTVWVNLSTRCPLNPDHTPVQPGQPGCAAEPLCETCAPIVRHSVDRKVPLAKLFPLHHLTTTAAPTPEGTR